MRKRTIALFSLTILLLLACLPFKQSEASNQTVYVVPIEDTVEKGLYAFLKRAVTQAEEDQASAIIFQINTPGGLVDAAGDIGKLLSETKLRTISYVDNQALSAGAYIALNTREIYMAPTGTFGAAAVIDSAGNMADTKAQSYWLSAMKAAAEATGRDPAYALAMADPTAELPKFGVEKGELLTLTADQAEEIGYSKGSVATLDELLVKLDLSGADIKQVEESFAEKVARFLTHPVVVPILLSLGTLGLIWELFSPGFGIPGFVGLSSLLLFFYGHMVAGLAGFESLILFVIGIALLLIEIFIPGGIVGVLGLAAVVGSFFLATDNDIHMAISLFIALFVGILASILMVKVFGKKMSLFKKIILTDSTKTDLGYVSNKNRPELVGKIGVTVTALRPAGAIVIDDERMDVVSEGNFIAKDVTVKIIKTEGARIVVRELEEVEQ